MAVHYKFNTADLKGIVKFDSLHISVKDLRECIKENHKFKGLENSLLITNEQTNEEYKNDNDLIIKNSSVIIRRIPIADAKWKKSSKTYEQTSPIINNNFYKTMKSTNAAPIPRLSNIMNISTAEGTEAEKIQAVIQQSNSEYDPINYSKCRKTNSPLPPNYVCHRCYMPGHHIKDCPTNNINMKRSTGIPRDFLVKVDGPNVMGALRTSTGEYGVPAMSQLAYQAEALKNSLKKNQEKFEATIPQELSCNLCKNLLDNPVTIHCCKAFYCYKCIHEYFAGDVASSCPSCLKANISLKDIFKAFNLKNKIAYYKNSQNFFLKNSDSDSSDSENKKENSPTPSVVMGSCPGGYTQSDDSPKSNSSYEKENFPINVQISSNYSQNPMITNPIPSLIPGLPHLPTGNPNFLHYPQQQMFNAYTYNYCTPSEYYQNYAYPSQPNINLPAPIVEQSNFKSENNYYELTSDLRRRYRSGSSHRIRSRCRSRSRNYSKYSHAHRSRTPERHYLKYRSSKKIDNRHHYDKESHRYTNKKTELEPSEKYSYKRSSNRSPNEYNKDDSYHELSDGKYKSKSPTTEKHNEDLLEEESSNSSYKRIKSDSSEKYSSSNKSFKECSEDQTYYDSSSYKKSSKTKKHDEYQLEKESPNSSHKNIKTEYSEKLSSRRPFSNRSFNKYNEDRIDHESSRYEKSTKEKNEEKTLESSHRKIKSESSEKYPLRRLSSDNRILNKHSDDDIRDDSGSSKNKRTESTKKNYTISSKRKVSDEFDEDKIQSNCKKIKLESSEKVPSKSRKHQCKRHAKKNDSVNKTSNKEGHHHLKISDRDDTKSYNDNTKTRKDSKIKIIYSKRSTVIKPDEKRDLQANSKRTLEAAEQENIEPALDTAKKTRTKIVYYVADNPTDLRHKLNKVKKQKKLKIKSAIPILV